MKSKKSASMESPKIKSLDKVKEIISKGLPFSLSTSATLLPLLSLIGISCAKSSAVIPRYINVRINNNFDLKKKKKLCDSPF